MRIIGTDEAERIKLGEEDDICRALGGDDTVVSAFEVNSIKGSKPVYADLVFLGGGNDLARGFIFADTIHGGAGDDHIATGSDNGWGDFSSTCKIYGDRGDDYIRGGLLMDGGSGNDTLEGEGRFIGGKGDDVYICYGWLKGDIVDRHGASDIDVRVDEYYYGEDSRRIITAGGKDKIHLQGDYDYTVRSGGGADSISAHSASLVDAGRGNDTVWASGAEIRGGAGRDELSYGALVKGGADHDVIRYAGDYEGGYAKGGAGNDTIAHSSNAHGGRGDDVLDDCKGAYGGGGDDTISDSKDARGNQGDDLLIRCVDAYGGGGDDTIANSRDVHGGGGDDFITGRGLLHGDGGNDTLEGSSPANVTDDELFGGGGDDRLLFGYGEGDDTLEGGDGPDVFVLKSFLPDQPPYLVLTADLIADFEQGIDKIDLSADADTAVPDGFTGREGVTSFDELVIAQAGADVAIKDSEGYVLVLVADQLAGDFTADDFLF